MDQIRSRALHARPWDPAGLGVPRAGRVSEGIDPGVHGGRGFPGLATEGDLGLGLLARRVSQGRRHHTGRGSRERPGAPTRPDWKGLG